MRFVRPALTAFLTLCAAPLAFAQQPPSNNTARSVPPPLTTAPSAAGAPTAAAPSSSGSAQVATSPTSATAAAPSLTTVAAPPSAPMIDVDDPLLAPVPAAAHTFGGFKEVLTLLSNDSLTLKIAQQEVARVEGQKRVALAAVLPRVTAIGRASATPLRPEPAISQTSQVLPFTQQVGFVQASLGLTQPISIRDIYALGTTDKSLEASKLRAEDARRTAIAAAASAIVAVVTAERVAEINRVGLRAALQRLELTKRRKRLGSGTDLDIVRAEQDAASARSQIVTGDENLRKAREALGQLFGKSDAYGVPSTFTLNDIEPALRGACTQAKAEDRTDVLAAKADLEVAKRGVTEVKLTFAPTAEVSTNVNFQSNIIDAGITQNGTILGRNTLTQDAASWSIAALLTIPIWDGGARYGQMKTASATVTQAQTRVEQATVTATLEAQQAQRAITVADAAKAVSEKSRDLARETARLSQVAFESGSGTSLDLVDSGRVLRQAELDLAVKELEVVRAKIAALLALSTCKL